MPRIIFTSNYIKPKDRGRARKIKNYVNYIATRPNAEKCATRETDIENYVGYIAKRPRAEKYKSGHALWNGSEEKISLSKVAKEAAEHKGNIWTHVVSLKREDAERLGYNNAEAWRNLVCQKAAEIAKEMKIPLDSFVWYAAFHNEGHHPHIHMMCYSKNPKKGYLTKKGIENLRSSFAKEIFHDEIYHIYEQKDEVRDILKELFDKRLEKALKREFKENEKVELLLFQLAENLKTSKHKKVYGRLDKENRLLVDEIVEEIGKDEKISETYQAWQGLKDEILASYQNKERSKKSLKDETEFRNIKNMVLKAALRISEQEESEENNFLQKQGKEDFSKSNQENSERGNREDNIKSEKEAVQKNGTDKKEYCRSEFLRLMKNISRMIEEDYGRKEQYVKPTDKKLMKKITEKKQAHGQKM